MIAGVKIYICLCVHIHVFQLEICVHTFVQRTSAYFCVCVNMFVNRRWKYALNVIKGLHYITLPENVCVCVCARVCVCVHARVCL